MPDPTVPSREDEDLAAIASLDEPVRRSLYRFVVSQEGEVGRDAAAEAAGIQRSLAAFHLDKLVEAGLLQVTYRRLSGRTGPGAGRPAKLYRRSPSERGVTLPPRRYDLAAELLLEAVEEAGRRSPATAVKHAARRFGLRLGEQIRASLGARASRQRRLGALRETLGRYGYEPRIQAQSLRLGNCPFHALAEGHRELVCGLNLSLLEGVVEGMDAGDIEARRDAGAGACCVALVASPQPGP